MPSTSPFAIAWAKLELFANALARTLAVIAGVAVALIVVSVIYDVTARNLGFSGLRGIVEYGAILMVAVVFLSIGYAQMENAHISIELFVERLPERVTSAIDGTVLTALALFLGWATYETLQAAISSLERGEIRFGLVSVPVWPARMMIPLGLFSMALQCLVQAAPTLSRAFPRNNDAEPDSKPLAETKGS